MKIVFIKNENILVIKLLFYDTENFQKIDLSNFSSKSSNRYYNNIYQNYLV